MRRTFSLSLFFLLLCGMVFAQETWMPDPGLRGAVREALRLEAHEPFTRTDLLQLHRLDPYKMGVRSLKGLEHAKNLTWFSFAENDVTDLSPLAGLIHLETLYGWSNVNLSDLSPIANLRELRRLNISVCEISDIAPIENLRKLERLDLSYNNIENIQPIGNLSALTELLLKHNKIVDVRPLANLSRLEILHINNNLIGDFSALDGLALTDFIYDPICLLDLPSVKPQIRFENRSHPSVFQPWSGVSNRPDLSPLARIALHDLYIGPSFKLNFLKTPKGYQLIGDLQTSQFERSELTRLNPNIIVIAEIAVRDNWPSAYPEDWEHWIRDENGNRVSAVMYPAFLVDFTHPDVINIIVEQAVAIRQCGLYDGIFLDWWKEGTTVLWNDFSTAPHRTNKAEQTARDRIIRRIRDAVGEDFLIIVNPNRDKPRRAAPYINGLFMETGEDSPSGYTYQGLVEIEETLLWAESTLREPRINALEGEGINAESPESRDNLRNMRLITTLSLTHSDGYVIYNKGSRGVDPSLPHHGHIWTDFWEPKLGKPVGARAQRYQTPKGVAIDGLFIREFDLGYAVYNRSGKQRRIQLPEKVSGFSSGVEDKLWHTIGDLDGEIYLKSIPQSIPMDIGKAPEVPEVNPADLNGDGIVNVLDLVIVANAFGKDSPDLNVDGTVNVLDLVVVANAFGN